MSFSFVGNELEVLKFWEKHQTFKKSLTWSQNFPRYISYDGPPFATGLPHHGHLLASTIKDVVFRYQTQTGHYIERRFGWDCHGLPIEHEINKLLGLQADEAVEKLGIAGYNQACRDIVMRYSQQWQQTIERLGRWVDFDHDYKTMDKDFMESVFWVFSQLWDKGMIYEGVKVVPYSTSLQTALSNFEAGSNYQKVQDPAITVLAYINEQEAFAIWTTTPWTLPANLAIGVHRDLTYCRVSITDIQPSVWIAEQRLESCLKKREYKILERKKGQDLIGIRYQPIFTELQHQACENAYQILSADFVTTDAGTGLVHLAPAFGEDDYNLCLENGIKALLCPIDHEGKFDDSFPQLSGQYIKDADKWIIKSLKNDNKLLAQEVCVHSYPFCPRSDTPLIYKAIPSWFVSVSKIKERLIESNEAINWVPEHIKSGRFGKWLENARDWAISRNRVWGTPIPLWRNDQTNNIICIDSIAMLTHYTGVTVTDLHREHVDPLTFTIEGEKGTYRRIAEVLDCWFESGAMPYAQNHYPFESKELVENNFPADFIAEGLDQTRGWFYTLTILSTILFEKPAFKNVIVSGIVMAKDGKKMSKRLKNYTAPDELMATYGADALRLYLISSNLVKGEEQRFSDIGVKEVIRSTLLPWYNAFKFFDTYAKIDQWRYQPKSLPLTDLDRWILSKLQTLIAQVNSNMQAYKLYQVVPPLLDFIDELTNTYIRMNRNRFWTKDNCDDKEAAYQTLFEVLLNLSKLMAPFAPFLSESIFQSLKFYHDEAESVHLCHYPVTDKNKQSTALETGIRLMQEVINMARSERVSADIKLKTPLNKVTIIHQNTKLLDTLRPLSERLCIELNVKSIEFDTNEDKYIKLYAKPNLPILGKRFGKDLPSIKALIEKLNTVELKSFETSSTITVKDITFTQQDLLIFREPLTEISCISNRYITIALDTTLTDALRLEGQAREMVSIIQKTRKSLDLNIDQRITLVIQGKDALHVFDKHSEYITGEVLAKQWTASQEKQPHNFDVLLNSFNILT
jgi:isoleucyl-tRNA synthetase